MVQRLGRHLAQRKRWAVWLAIFPPVWLAGVVQMIYMGVRDLFAHPNDRTTSVPTAIALIILSPFWPGVYYWGFIAPAPKKK